LLELEAKMAARGQEYMELKTLKENKELIERRRIERIADKGCQMMKVIQDDEIKSKAMVSRQASQQNLKNTNVSHLVS
jgi:hypothetical protein